MLLRTNLVQLPEVRSPGRLMLPDRANLKRMLVGLDTAIASAVKYHPDEADFRDTLCASAQLLMLEGSEVDHEWIKGQLEEMLARHGLKDFEL